MEIELTPIVHRNCEQILIKYSKNRELDLVVRKIKGVKWSQSNKAWYLPLSKLSYDLILKALAIPQVKIITASLKQYLEKRQALTAHQITTESNYIEKPRQATILANSIRELSSHNAKQLELYIQHLQLHGRQTSTIITYRTEFLSFLITLKKHKADEFTTDRIKDYLQYCYTTLKASEHSLHSKINALKYYYEKVLNREKFFWDIPRAKKPFQLPKVLNETELKRLFEAAKNLKHKAILFVAYSAGLRVSEVINLRLQDIDRERQQLFIHCSKGKKDRYVRLSVLVLDILEQYYKLSKVKPTNYLFEGVHPGEPYSVRSAQTIFATAKADAGISKSLSFHSLRHSFATHLLEKGVNVSYIKAILGHFDIKTTERYLHIKRDTLINIESPLDSLYTKNKYSN
jgi:integrase/recombinase XerD